jgi:hypothetical protein
MRSAAALLFALLLAVSPAAAPQTTAKAPAAPAKATESLPPLSYTCPMHPEIIEDKKGQCPICKMDLVPVRLDSVWTCASKPLAVVKDQAGRCPIDGTPLVMVTASVSWTCPGTDIKELRPGTCADGSAMTKKYDSFAHGNHNPQHGGIFFMAPDNWHHIEGAMPRAGVFRAYFYDNYSKPLKRAEFAAVKGRIATEQTFDPVTKKTKEITAFPLVPVAGGNYYEAKIGKVALPADMTARVTFKKDGQEYPFDFTFAALTKEPVTPSAVTTGAAPAAPVSAPAAPSAPDASAPATGEGGGGATTAAAEIASGVDPALIVLPIPDTVPDMLKQLRTRTTQIRGLIDRGSFGSIYVPAFQAKDIALALEDHKKDLSEDRQRVVEPAVAKLVRSAWLLDAFGDIGNKLQISEAYDQFVAAEHDIQTSFPERP